MFPCMEFLGKRGKQVAETVQVAVRQAGGLVLTALVTACVALVVAVAALAMAARRPAHA